MFSATVRLPRTTKAFKAFNVLFSHFLMKQLFAHLSHIKEKCEVKVKTIKSLNKTHDIMRVKLSKYKVDASSAVHDVSKRILFQYFCNLTLNF